MRKFRLSALALLIAISSFAIAPAHAVDAPTNVTVVSLDRPNTAQDAAQLSVSWTAVPAPAVLAGYRVEVTPAGGTMAAYPVANQTTTSTVITGLTGGTNYNVVVKSFDGTTYSAGTTPVAARANSIPSTPTAVSIVAGAGQVTLVWTAPASNGGPDLGSYKITANGGVSKTATATELTKVVDGLTAGGDYTFTIKATNSIGDSVGAIFAATQIPSVPGVPTAVTARASGTKVTVAWQAPVIDGNSTITGYTAYLIKDNADAFSKDVTITSAEFTDIPAGVYTAKVIAKNLIGSSDRSAVSPESAEVKAASTLKANEPTLNQSSVNEVQIDGTLTVSSTAPSGGTVSYEVTANPSNACSGSTSSGSVTITGGAVGTCTITATTTTLGEFDAGSNQKTVNIVKKLQTITFPAVSSPQQIPGPLNLGLVVTASSGLTVTLTAAPSSVCTASGTNGTTITLVGAGACTVTATQAGNATYSSATGSRNFTVNAASSSAGGDAGGGGGGGGGAPKQTALYFQVVDPTDSTKIYTKSVCVEIYSRTLSPQFMGTGCSLTDGRVNILAADGKVSIRVFELGNGAVYREYLGEIATDTFTIENGAFFPGTTRWVVTFSKAIAPPVVTPTPTPVTPTPTPTPTPVTPTPTPTPTPATPTPTPTPTPVAPTPTPSPTAAKSTFFVTTTSTKNLTKLSLRYASASTSSKVGKSLQLTVPSVGTKTVPVKVSVKDPAGKSYQVASVTVSKNKSYSAPIVKFAKPGTYVFTTYVGTAKKVMTVKVGK